MTLFGEDTALWKRAVRGGRARLVHRRLPRIRRRPVYVVGHRGHAGHAPENTVASCRSAIHAGADGVEVDVCVTRDGHPVLWHDRDPDDPIAVARQHGAEAVSYVPRVPRSDTGLRRPVSELSAEDFLASHGYHPLTHVAMEWVGADARDTAPPDTLADLLAWAADEPRCRALVLDPKLGPDDVAHVPGLLDALARELAAHEALADRHLELLATHREVFSALLAGRPGNPGLGHLRLVPDFELPGAVDAARRGLARHLSVGISPRRSWWSVRDELLDLARTREARRIDGLTVWTANQMGQLEDLVRLSVDTVVTDEIALALEIREKG